MHHHYTKSVIQPITENTCTLEYTKDINAWNNIPSQHKKIKCY